MAYSKTVWNNNTPPDISAENLNKMEQGIADAQFPDGGSTGQILSKTNDGTGWVDAPTSAEWGNIEGQLSEQTDLYSELESKITMPSGGTTGQVLTKTATGQAWQDASGGGNVDTVNGISPNAQKNVEVDIELTKAEYDALPSSKLTDGVNYWIKDGTNLPQASVISAEGVMYTDSQTVKGALDSQASAISDLNNGLVTLGDEINCVIPLTSTGWIIGSISTPTKNGYALVGYLLRTNTYRIVSMSYQISGATTSINAYVNSTATTPGNVFCLPIFKKNA